MNNKKIIASSSQIEIIGIKNLLDSAGIEYFELNKSDSAYVGVFDNYEIYVDPSDEEKALAILKENAS